MINNFKIDRTKNTPVYQQIVDTITLGIEQGVISEGDQIPSINQIANEQHLARETVVKAFKFLQQKGIIKPIHGKGYFVSTKHINIKHRVFILFDTLSPYKEILYHSIQEAFGENAYLDIYFHHYNCKVFQQLIEDAAGNYTSYIILPVNNDASIQKLSQLLPSDKLYIIDQKPACLDLKVSGIFQDFKKDVLSGLGELKSRIEKYQKLVLFFRNTNTVVPIELKDGFVEFCKKHMINYEIIETQAAYNPQKGEAFLIIDNEDLVSYVEHAMNYNWQIGKDIGIISYNDTSLKKVVAGGISVISTDFNLMGKSIVEMILTSKHELKANPSKFIDRGSL